AQFSRIVFALQARIRYQRVLRQTLTNMVNVSRNVIEQPVREPIFSWGIWIVKNQHKRFRFFWRILPVQFRGNILALAREFFRDRSFIFKRRTPQPHNPPLSFAIDSSDYCRSAAIDFNPLIRVENNTCPRIGGLQSSRLAKTFGASFYKLACISARLA